MAANRDKIKIPRLSDDDLSAFNETDQDSRQKCDPTVVLTEKNKQRLQNLDIDWLHDSEWYPLQKDVDTMCQDMTVDDIEFMYWILIHLSPNSVYDEIAEAAMCKALHLPIPEHPDEEN